MAEDEAGPDDAASDPGTAVRALMRRAGQAMLASLLARDRSGWPYASLVLSTVDHDASPILLLSDLADHSRNLKTDSRAALLYDGTAGYADPLAGPRAAVLGRIQEVTEGAERARLTARLIGRHPSAREYAGFADFRLYRMAIDRAHLVAGFGRIHWLAAEAVRYPAEGCGALAEAEAEICAHMNADHAAALQEIAAGLPDGRSGERSGWVMTGIDPEGFDLRRGSELARLDFSRQVADPQAARAELARMARLARERARSRAGPRSESA